LRPAACHWPRCGCCGTPAQPREEAADDLAHELTLRTRQAEALERENAALRAQIAAAAAPAGTLVRLPSRLAANDCVTPR